MNYDLKKAHTAMTTAEQKEAILIFSNQSCHT